MGVGAPERIFSHRAMWPQTARTPPGSAAALPLRGSERFKRQRPAAGSARSRLGITRRWGWRRRSRPRAGRSPPARSAPAAARPSRNPVQAAVDAVAADTGRCRCWCCWLRWRPSIPHPMPGAAARSRLDPSMAPRLAFPGGALPFTSGVTSGVPGEPASVVHYGHWGRTRASRGSWGARELAGLFMLRGVRRNDLPGTIQALQDAVAFCA